MDEKDKIRLLHIIDSGEKLSRFIKGRQKDDLKNDDMLLLASLKCIEIIGEAADKISNEFKMISSRGR